MRHGINFFGEKKKLVDDTAVVSSTDTKKYFDPAPFGNDIDRVGLSYLKSGGVKK